MWRSFVVREAVHQVGIPDNWRGPEAQIREREEAEGKRAGKAEGAS